MAPSWLVRLAEVHAEQPSLAGTTAMETPHLLSLIALLWSSQ